MFVKFLYFDKRKQSADSILSLYYFEVLLLEIENDYLMVAI